MREFLVVAMVAALACAGCGDGDDGAAGSAGSGGTAGSAGSGGTAGSAGSGGTAGSAGSSGGGDTCNRICESPCIDTVLGFRDECLQECQQGAVVACESELIALLDCYEGVDCDVLEAAFNCSNQAVAFDNCIR